MKIKINKNEYSVIILEQSKIKSNHTDLDISKYSIEFTIYDEADKKTLKDIISEKIITIINGEIKNYSIINSSHSNSSTDNFKSEKYRLEIQEIEKLSLEILNIDGIEFKPYHYEEYIDSNGLNIFSKIKTDKKNFELLNEKKFSKEISTVIRVGISDKPIQAKIHPARQWSEVNGEYKLIVAFSQVSSNQNKDSLAGDIAKFRDYNITNRSMFKTLLKNLVSKNILNESDSESILKESMSNFNIEFIEYHKVKDID